ncbi:MAG TPA: hypothetical protein VHL34_13455 [Rhizomicrobium sp.]|jgi:hypothetical protein|nr:hypothetical protein [Rhizomicrobium sp.]
MGELTLEKVQAELTVSDRHAYFEQRIFVLSPFGTPLTTLLLFVLFAGSFLLCATVEHQPLLVQTATSVTLDQRARVALTLSLLLVTVLGIQRYTRVRERAELASAATIFRGGLATVGRVAVLTPAGAHLGLASLIGLVIGIGLSWLALLHDAHFSTAPLTIGWYVVIICLLTMSFARGVELTRQGSKSGIAAVENELVIDLLRIDRLSFLGRSAARFALIWFAIGAVSCLFFVSNGISMFTVGLIAMMLLIGASTFFGMMERVHRRIKAVKAEELERIRHQIDGLRDQAAHDASAAARLQGLLAYETRITAAPEWPFDQPTLVRLCASALILTLPWFGQAIAADLIAHLGTS